MRAVAANDRPENEDLYSMRTERIALWIFLSTGGALLWFLGWLLTL